MHRPVQKTKHPSWPCSLRLIKNNTLNVFPKSPQNPGYVFPCQTCDTFSNAIAMSGRFFRFFCQFGTVKIHTMVTTHGICKSNFNATVFECPFPCRHYSDSYFVSDISQNVIIRLVHDSTRVSTVHVTNTSAPVSFSWSSHQLRPRLVPPLHKCTCATVGNEWIGHFAQNSLFLHERIQGALGAPNIFLQNHAVFRQF